MQKNLLEICRETTQEIDKLLQHNIGNSTEDLPARSSQCITDNSSIEGTPDKKCEFLETYISYAEHDCNNDLQEEMFRLKNRKRTFETNTICSASE